MSLNLSDDVLEALAQAASEADRSRSNMADLLLRGALVKPGDADVPPGIGASPLLGAGDSSPGSTSSDLAEKFKPDPR